MMNNTMTPSFYQDQSEKFRMKHIEADHDSVENAAIVPGIVEGLNEVPEGSKHRQGDLVLIDTIEEPLKIVADHAYPIPDGIYELIGYYSQFLDSYLWVVGQKREDGKFEKFSVFRSADNEGVKAKELKLKYTRNSLC